MRQFLFLTICLLLVKSVYAPGPFGVIGLYLPLGGNSMYSPETIRKWMDDLHQKHDDFDVVEHPDKSANGCRQWLKKFLGSRN